MELRQLRYFVDIAKTEHLTTSARNLFVTQSTLSHGLRQLEEELGMVLFERIGRGLKLSQAGVVFRNYAERALHEIEAGRMALADLSELQTGALTLGVIPTFLNTLVAPAVAAFTRAYPRVNVVVRELLAPPVEAGLLDGSLDLGVSFHPPQRVELEALPPFDERMLLLVNPSHALAGRRTLAIKSLAGVPLALLPRSFYTRGLIDNGLRDAGVTPCLRVEMGSVESLIALCRWGDMATIVPERAAQQASDMVAIPLVGPQLVRTAGLLWRRGSHYGAAAREFAALLAPAARASLGREGAVQAAELQKQ
ncbi:LysR family transcriptional regulator [Comamonas phosphati]|nr:LysR family transcriptional regulator [Comamonas phosphati]